MVKKINNNNKNIQNKIKKFRFHKNEILNVSPSFINQIKQNDNFIVDDDVNNNNLSKPIKFLNYYKNI